MGCYFESQLDKELQNIPLLVLVEQKSQGKVKRSHIALGIVGVMFFFVLFGFWHLDRWMVNILGFVFPAYASIKAIEPVDKSDDTQWLTYWVVFGLFTVLEFFSPTILYLFSWYYVVKFFFILWLISPVNNGASTLYSAVLKPIWGKIPPLPISGNNTGSDKKNDDETKDDFDEEKSD